ncbi:MAG: T9SS type A sorting domain-containing protein, partial [Bacteroidales bacterium]|nr:T9SS type A sorting domain-containing protein [Bacteroidales bacterium]
CDSFDWYEHTGITQSCENLTHTFTNAAGCDSIVTLHLTVNYTTYGDTNAIACDSFDWYEHTGITQSCENLTHTFTNAAGCDSIVTLHLTVNYTTYGDTTAIACNSFDWYEHTGITQSCGNLTHMFTNAAGCDSVVTLHLTVNYTTYGDTIAFACDSFTWYGTTYTETPDVDPTHTLTNAFGCDSVLTLHLTIGHSNTGDTTAIACSNFTWYGTTYTETPALAPTHAFTNASGCDSVVTLHLTINTPVTESIEVIACDSYTWNEEIYAETGDYTQTFTAANGCDSIVTLHLTINNSVTEFIEATACDSFTWNDSVYTESGDYTQIFPAANGCDSVVTLYLTINNSVTEIIEATACENYTWNGVTYTESGDYTQVYPGANDCDFVLTLRLTINTPVAELIEATACDSYTWNGVTYTESGDYIQIFTAANDCDSVVTLHLTINNSISELVEVYACDSYIWNDSVYTESGDYTLSFTAANGCDSVVTLHLTINSPVEELVYVTACDSYIWNDSVYTESGDYTQTFTATTGCDSVVTLHLTVNHFVSEFVEATACDSYVWNDSVYTESGDYTQTLTAANDCDSVVTLHLTIHESVLVDDYLTIHESDLPYTYADTTFEPGTVQSGDFVFNFTTVDGCDSVIVLHLTIETSVPSHFSAFDMKVYPNPTTGNLLVEFEEVGMNTQLQVYDIYGKLVMQYSINDRLTELNIGHFANGVYLLRMIDGSSGSKMVKVVKQ